jgi:hypothetical protein
VPARGALSLDKLSGLAAPLADLVPAGGTPGWQIALIAAGAALLTAMLAVLADRVRAAHHKTAPAS